MQPIRVDKLQLSSVQNRKSNIPELLALSTALALFLIAFLVFFRRVTKPLPLTLVRP